MNFDFSPFKDFPITEQVKVQFRTEFNVFNTPQFDLPNATIFGRSRGHHYEHCGIPRQIQFGLKIVF